MERKLFRTSLMLAHALFLFLVTLGPTHAQLPTSPERDAVVAEIKTYAGRHAKNSSSMQTQLVVELFRNNAAGLTSQEVARIYEEEYIRFKDANKPSPWEQLFPDTGWVVAGILLVLLIIRDLLKDWLTKFFKAISEAVYEKLAGKRLFWRAALNHYRKALLGKSAKIHIPFRPNRPLDMREVYVPLKVAGAAYIAHVEAYLAVSNNRRLMLKGSPGSGKSMLLKHIALSYAEGRLSEFLADQPVPVVLELHRFNDPKVTFEDQLVAELSRNDFPQAKRFVFSALEQGRLMVLLDGLDEVNSGERKRVVRSLKDSLEKYKNCRAVITCRAATYRGEFDELVEQTLEIVEFDDQQIRRLLGSWEQDMSSRGKSVEQLMQTLYDRPRILALARNPLLLTTIAYLYTDTEFVLPHSRAEFYRKSTDILLDLWHQEHNRFKASDKRLVLQHLALFNQDATAQQGHDRLTMERVAVLEQVRKILPDLNLKAESADSVLEEIVERSGLLLSVDGGERYQFAHLTLQEYFAATEIDDADGLLGRFRADRDAWRETVKLWCGLDRDSTELIRAINAEEPITAFECLADAQMVQSELADGILDSFKASLGLAGVDDAIVRAFGSVASDMRPRGQAVFESLRDILVATQDATRKIAAANALSLTNLPNAAQLLSGYYSERVELRAALLRMGDLAVPALKSLIATRTVDAMNDLLDIGTPQAAAALVPWLWHADKDASTRAAWRLAVLLTKPGVEDSLRDFPLKPAQRKANYIDWVWQPFNEPENSALVIIAGRIAFLLKRASSELAPTTVDMVDPRLAVPLCAILRFSEAGLPAETPLALKEHRQLFKNLPRILDEPSLSSWLRTKREHVGPRGEAKIVGVDDLLGLLNPTPTWRLIFLGLPTEVQIDLLGRLLIGCLPGRKEHLTPTEDDWRSIYRPVRFDLSRSWHYRVNVLAVVLISVFDVVCLVDRIQHSPKFMSWGNALSLVSAGLVMVWCGTVIYQLKKAVGEMGAMFLASFLGPLVSIAGVVFDISRKTLGFNTLLGAVVITNWNLVSAYYVTRALLGVYSWPAVAAIWFVFLGVVVTLWRMGKLRDRKARNPLQEIIPPQNKWMLAFRRTTPTPPRR